MQVTKFPLLSLSRLRMEIDGEGVTTLIAGSGCPLRCKHCINAALLKNQPELVGVQELYDRVKCDDLYFQATGGGVTFGGGEALLHAEFIYRFHALCKDRWRIYVETSLHVPRALLDAALPAVDGYIVDVKALDPEIYRDYTGGDLSLVRSNLNYLLSKVGPECVHVRLPIIPGFSTAEDQARWAEQLYALGVTRLELFTYVIKQ